MGIDGIGRAPPVAAPDASAPTAATGGDFRVGGAAAAAPASELGRLERGEIGLEQYLDSRVVEATRHLSAHLSAEQLAAVKETLRAELTTDPVLVELVRRATGKTPESAAT